MGISPYYRRLREAVGQELLLIPGVGGIIRNPKGEILFLRKGDGSWSLPAGAIEPGESPTQALVREVWEETGLRVTPIRLAGVYGGEAFRYTYPNGDQVEHLALLYECQIIEGELDCLDGEAVELGFFPPEELPELPLPYPKEIFTDWEESAWSSTQPGGSAPDA